jgi:hypothetical protein
MKSFLHTPPNNLTGDIECIIDYESMAAGSVTDEHINYFMPAHIATLDQLRLVNTTDSSLPKMGISAEEFTLFSRNIKTPRMLAYTASAIIDYRLFMATSDKSKTDKEEAYHNEMARIGANTGEKIQEAQEHTKSIFRYLAKFCVFTVASDYSRINLNVEESFIRKVQEYYMALWHEFDVHRQPIKWINEYRERENLRKEIISCNSAYNDIVFPKKFIRDFPTDREREYIISQEKTIKEYFEKLQTTKSVE